MLSHRKCRNRLTRLLVLLVLGLPSLLMAAQDPLVMGVFPRRNTSTTITFFTPLAKYLAQQLGREVRLETTRDYPAFWNNVVQRRYDIVHYNQYHYIKSHRGYGYDVIARNQEFGKDTLAGVIIVRKDSGIETINDLKGKKIIFGGGKMAMMAYVVPKYLLKQSGLMDRDYIEDIAKNPPNSLLAVYYGQADAAGTGDIVLDVPSVSKAIDSSELKIIAISEQMAHVNWAIRKDLPGSLKKKIQDSLVALNTSEKGQAILKRANITGLVVSEDKDYDMHRKILKEVFGEQY